MNRQFTSPRTRLFSEHHREPADEHGSYAFITDPLRIRLPLEFTPEGVGDPSGVLVRYFSRGGDRGMRLFLLWQDDRPREADPVWEDHIQYCVGLARCARSRCGCGGWILRAWSFASMSSASTKSL
jgi:hypothetical protein